MDCVTAVNEAIAEASSPEAALEAYIKENLRIAAAEDHGWMMGLAEGISGLMGTDIASAQHELSGACDRIFLAIGWRGCWRRWHRSR
ncbi:hypothetical protein FRC0426_02167 [Corynebacterium diphtheriae]|nr:hypothetical protein FRC0402_02146 [Corynebacterium diphtheriae]CAB0919672.1 hypothetical protein FRC0426_02167 [Corynebacterium diphtheriae]